MTFIWFFLTIYLFTSMMNYVLHGQTVLDDLLEFLYGESIYSQGTFRRIIGDFSIRGLYVAGMYYTSAQLVSTY